VQVTSPEVLLFGRSPGLPSAESMTLAACFKKPVALQVLEEAEDDFLVEDRAMKVRERLAKKVVVSGERSPRV
jgi:hypothetical protein